MMNVILATIIIAAAGVGWMIGYIAGYARGVKDLWYYIRKTYE